MKNMMILLNRRGLRTLPLAKYQAYIESRRPRIFENGIQLSRDNWRKNPGSACPGSRGEQGRAKGGKSGRHAARFGGRGQSGASVVFSGTWRKLPGPRRAPFGGRGLKAGARAKMAARQFPPQQGRGPECGKDWQCDLATALGSLFLLFTLAPLLYIAGFMFDAL